MAVEVWWDHTFRKTDGETWSVYYFAEEAGGTPAVGWLEVDHDDVGTVAWATEQDAIEDVQVLGAIGPTTSRDRARKLRALLDSAPLDWLAAFWKEP